jgi:hypothetical protein
MKNGINTIDRNDWKILVRNQLTEKRHEIEQAKIAAALATVVAPVPERRFPFRLY